MSAISSDAISITTLAKQIADISEQVVSYLGVAQSCRLSFDASSPEIPDTAQYETLRARLNDAALDLLRLVNGPRNSLRSLFLSHYDLSALQVALDRRFFDHVPIDISKQNGPHFNEGLGVSAAEIAKKSGMDEDRTARIMALLTTHRIFEQVPGEEARFRHTAASALLAKDQDYHAMADMQLDDMLRATSEMSSLIKKYPHEADARCSAFHTAYGATVYDYYERHPVKAKRFAQAMSSWARIDRQVSELSGAFRWGTLSCGKVVDVGGGSGHVSMALARRYPSLSFIVQDVSLDMLAMLQGPSMIDLEGRISFQQHDFFQTQPVCDADVYLIRQCLHNLNDNECVKLIRAIVPALERNREDAVLLINDIIMPSSGAVTRYEEGNLRQVDMCMMVLFGAKQRSEKDFANVLRNADPRLRIVRVYNDLRALGLLEVRLDRPVVGMAENKSSAMSDSGPKL